MFSFYFMDFTLSMFVCSVYGWLSVLVVFFCSFLCVCLVLSLIFHISYVCGKEM